MPNDNNRILAKLANPEEREEKRLQLLLSLPSAKPDKKASSGATVTLPSFNRLGEEERA